MREYFNLLTDINHWLFELTVEGFTGILLYPFIKLIWRRAIKRHDEKFHPHEVHT